MTRSRALGIRVQRAGYATVKLGMLNPLWRQCERWLLKRARCSETSRLVICIDGDLEDAALLSTRIAEAVTLIEQHDPKRWMRMREDLSRVVCTAADAVNGAHFPRSRSCYLSAAFVRANEASIVATLLVHEATHARISHTGIPYFPDWRARIERRCVLEELSFASRLPGAAFPYMRAWMEWRMDSQEVARTASS